MKEEEREIRKRREGEKKRIKKKKVREIKRQRENNKEEKEYANLLALVEQPEDQCKEDDVEDSKQVLGQADVGAMARDVVQTQEEVDKSCENGMRERSKL